MAARTRSVLAAVFAALILFVAPAAFANTYGSGSYGGGAYNVGVDTAPAQPGGSGGAGVSYFPNWPTTTGGAAASSTNSSSSSTPATTATPAATSTTMCRAAQTFDRTLSRGMKGEDVRRLQEFLNARGFTIVESGDGSPGKESDEFGAKTEAALIRFQRANASAMNLVEFTGLFGETTRGYVNGLLAASSCGATSTTVPSAAAHDTLASLLARVAELRAMLATLQGGAPLPSSGVATGTFSRDLQLNDQGEDVRRLQAFLNANGYPVAASGAGARGAETTIFGPGTYRALVRYQADSGLPPTGFFGPMTRAVISGGLLSQ